MAGTGEALCEALLDDRMRQKLEEISRAACARCGAEGDTQRKPLKGEFARGSDKECCCQKCLFGLESGLAEEQQEPQTDAGDTEAESSTKMLATEEAEAETRAEDVVHTEAESSTRMQTTEESEAEMRAADVAETGAQSSASTQTTQAWQAVFCPRARAWYFYDAESRGEATWDRPSGSWWCTGTRLLYLRPGLCGETT